MKIQQRAIGKIKPYPGNPRKNAQAVDPVAASIREFGFRQPIVVDSDGVVIVGHTRLQAAAQLGLATVPVTVASDLTPEQARAYRLADNRTGENAEWDQELLGLELDQLAGVFDLSLTGFTPEEIRQMTGLVAPAEFPDMPDGDRAPFQLMTFTLHDTQAEIVRDAIRKARQAEGVQSDDNENSNGNALAYICAAYLA